MNAGMWVVSGMGGAGRLPALVFLQEVLPTRGGGEEGYRLMKCWWKEPAQGGYGNL